MQAYRFKNAQRPIAYMETVSSRSGATRYQYLGCTDAGLVQVELHDHTGKRRTVLTVHPSALWDVMVRDS